MAAAAAQPSTSSGRKQSKKKNLNLSLNTDTAKDNLPVEVCHKLFLGSLHAAFNGEALRQRGISHILNLSGMQPTFAGSFTYLNVDIKDKDTSDILSVIPPALIFINAGMKAGGVLVHCVGGRSRSVSIVIAWLLCNYGCSVDEAVAFLKRKRSVVEPNKAFELQLRAYRDARYHIYSAQQLLLFRKLAAAASVKRARNDARSVHVKHAEFVGTVLPTAQKVVDEEEHPGTSALPTAKLRSPRAGDAPAAASSHISPRSKALRRLKTMGAEAASNARLECVSSGSPTSSPRGRAQAASPTATAKTGSPASADAAPTAGAALPALAPNGDLSLLVRGKSSSTPTHVAASTAAAGGAGNATPRSARDKSTASPSARSVNSTGTARLSKSVVATMALTTVDLMTATNRRVCHFTLSRPGEPSAHIIPPLMGMQWKFRCDGCDHILFMSSSIVRPSKRSRQNSWMEHESGASSDSDRRPMTARHDRRAHSAAAPASTRARGNSGGDATASAAAAAVVVSARSPPAAAASTPRAGRRSGGRLPGLTTSPVQVSTAVSPNTRSPVLSPPGTAPLRPSVSVPAAAAQPVGVGVLSPVIEGSAQASRSNSSITDAQAQSATPLPGSERVSSLHLPASSAGGSDSLDALLASPRGDAVKPSTTQESSASTTVSSLSRVSSTSPQHLAPAPVLVSSAGAAIKSPSSSASPALTSSGSSIITSAVVTTTPIQPMYGRRQSPSVAPSGSLLSVGSSNTTSARPSSSQMSPRGDSTSLKSSGSFHVSMQSNGGGGGSSAATAESPSFAPAAAWPGAGAATSALPPPSTRNSSTRKGGFSFDDDAFGSDVAEPSVSNKGGLQPIVGVASGLDTSGDGGNAFAGFGDEDAASGEARSTSDGGEEDDVWALAPLAEDGAPLTPSGASRNRSGFAFDGSATPVGGDGGDAPGPPVALDVFGKAIKAPVVVDYSKRSGWKSTIAFDKGEKWEDDDRRRAHQVIDPTDKESLKARLRMLQELVESEDVTHAETAAATGGGAQPLGAEQDEDDAALGDVLCEGAEVQPLGLSPAADDVSLASPRSMPSLTSKRRPSTATRKRAADASQIVDEDLDASSFVVAGDVLFLEPLDWMGEMSGQMGHLRCPCCDAMLGFYDWAGAVVGTRAKVSPAFCVYTQSVWVQRPPAVSSDQTLGANTSPANVMAHSVSLPPEGARSPPRLAVASGQNPPAALTTSASIAM